MELANRGRGIRVSPAGVVVDHGDMGSMIGLLAAVGIVVSMLVIAVIFVAFAVAVRSTIVANRTDLALREDLERVLADVLGPREPADGPNTPR